MAIVWTRTEWDFKAWGRLFRPPPQGHALSFLKKLVFMLHARAALAYPRERAGLMQYPDNYAFVLDRRELNNACKGIDTMSLLDPLIHSML